MNICRLKIRHFWALTATLAMFASAHADLVFMDDSGHEVRLKAPADPHRGTIGDTWGTPPLRGAV